MRLNITFPIGVTCAPFNISLIDDVLSEDNETFNISILEESLPFGVILDDPDKTTVTIVENDCKYIRSYVVKSGVHLVS